MDDPVMEGFVSRLDEINGVADASPGFVWRLQGEDANARAQKVFRNRRLIINLSVWESLDALTQFTYKTSHVELIRGRKQWFVPGKGPHMALWWIKAGTIPTVEEAYEAIKLLEVRGPSPEAFTFQKTFPPPGEMEIGGCEDIPLFPGDKAEMVTEIRRGSILIFQRPDATNQQVVHIRAISPEEVHQFAEDKFVVQGSSSKSRLVLEKYKDPDQTR